MVARPTAGGNALKCTTPRYTNPDAELRAGVSLFVFLVGGTSPTRSLEDTNHPL